MKSLSSSFLKKYAPNYPTNIPSTPLVLVLPFKISSIKIDEKCHRISHQTPITNKRSIFLPKDDQQSTYDEFLKNSFLTNIFNRLDELICEFIDPPLHPSVDPKHVLSGNFAPVGELPPTPCTVVLGSLPTSLNGAYIRNGPNPQFIPRGPYHLFDGDGMLHSIKISNGEAIFCSRFVKTYKYNFERQNGSPVILNPFSVFNCGLVSSLARFAVASVCYLAGGFDPRRGVGPANTSLAVFAGKLLALGESDLPYRVKLTDDGDVITLGREECFVEPMTAHPKIDAESGEIFAFRHSITNPFLTYFRINPEGIKQNEVPIFSSNQASLVHDFAISQNYAVFPDSQIVIEPKEILKGKPPIRVDTAKVSRLGIIPRNAEDGSEMWWVEAPGLNIIHAVNAWEEDGGDTVVMVAPNVLGVEHFLERVDLIHSSMERIEINVRTKSIAKRISVCTRNLDFGVINPAYVGKKNRYMYAAIGGPMPKIIGVVKIDLSLSTTGSSGDCTVASHLYPPGCYGGEPFFVPKKRLKNPAAAEDDGYLVTYVHNENTEESNFLVLDAKSPNLDIVAFVKLPQRVPYGFHGIFVPECD